jgi:hypothetical protein
MIATDPAAELDLLDAETPPEPDCRQLKHRLHLEVNGRPDFLPAGTFVVVLEPDDPDRITIAAYNDQAGDLGPPVFVGDPDLATTAARLAAATA